MNLIYAKKDIYEVVFAFLTVIIASSIILFTYFSIYPSKAPDVIAALFEKPYQGKVKKPSFKVIRDGNAFSLH